MKIPFSGLIFAQYKSINIIILLLLLFQMHVQVAKNDNKTLAALQEATLFGQAFTCTYTVPLAMRGTGKKTPDTFR